MTAPAQGDRLLPRPQGRPAVAPAQAAGLIRPRGEAQPAQKADPLQEAGRASPDAIVELCALRVGDEEYVIDLRRIREIVQPLPVVPVPRAPEYVEGVMNLRGEVIPVVDVRKRLGLGPRPGPRAKVLVVNVAGRVMGLVVDGVAEVLRIPRSGIGPPPSLLAAAGSRLFLGVCGAREPRRGAAELARSGGRAAPQRLRLLLNVKALLEPATPVAAAVARQLATGAGPGPV